jgi:hypothetical protein
MPKPPEPPRKGLLKRLRSAVSDLTACEELELKEAYSLGRSKVRIPTADVPVELALGKHSRRLWLYPELPLTGNHTAKSAPDYLILDPDQFFSRISGFVRLRPGDKVTLGRDDKEQSAILGFTKDIARRQIAVGLTDGRLMFKNLAPDHHACLSPLLKEKKINRLWAWRRDKINRLREILDDPIRLLPPDKALDQLEAVNRILDAEPHRPRDSQGRPGGIVQLPDHLAPVIVGDLHTYLDHLLVILTQNQFFEALEAGEACLVILGDAVHCEIDGRMDEMEGSLLIMDFILGLKLRFPDRVFYLRGNHDSFSEELGKGGVPQGILWERYAEKTRGKKYRDELEAFYQKLPYFAVSKDFVACHAAPPVSKASREDLIDIRQHPSLVREVTQNRLHKPNRPGGYKQGDVKRLRKELGLGPEIPFIVGHTPLSQDDTIWADPNDIPNHYIVYTADPVWVGVIARVGEKMLPLRYPAEALSQFFPATKDAQKDSAPSEASN